MTTPSMNAYRPSHAVPDAFAKETQMTDIKQGLGFRATGVLQRAFVPASGKCCFVTLEAHVGDKSRKHELRAFDAPVVSQLSGIASGSIVTLTGVIDCEPLKNKAKADVQVDGRVAWIEKLTIKAVKVERAAAG